MVPRIDLQMIVVYRNAYWRFGWYVALLFCRCSLVVMTASYLKDVMIARSLPVIVEGQIKKQPMIPDHVSYEAIPFLGCHLNSNIYHQIIYHYLGHQNLPGYIISIFLIL